MSAMNRSQLMALASSLTLLLSGCSNLPGDKGSQGAVIGGVSGAAVGAAVGGEKHRVLGAILGGAVGAGGGYVVGANSDKITGKDRDSAEAAAKTSQQNPATPQDALKATTADVNNDGFVTLDEIVAMKQAGLTDNQMLDRMRATGQVFELTEEQRKYLRDRGVSSTLVSQMEQINSEKKSQILNNRGDVIGRERK